MTMHIFKACSIVTFTFTYCDYFQCPQDTKMHNECFLMYFVFC